MKDGHEPCGSQTGTTSGPVLFAPVTRKYENGTHSRQNLDTINDRFKPIK